MSDGAGVKFNYFKANWVFDGGDSRPTLTGVFRDLVLVGLYHRIQSRWYIIDLEYDTSDGKGSVVLQGHWIAVPSDVGFL